MKRFPPLMWLGLDDFPLGSRIEMSKALTAVFDEAKKRPRSRLESPNSYWEKLFNSHTIPREFQDCFTIEYRAKSLDFVGEEGLYREFLGDQNNNSLIITHTVNLFELYKVTIKKTRSKDGPAFTIEVPREKNQLKGSQKQTTNAQWDKNVEKIAERLSYEGYGETKVSRGRIILKDLHPLVMDILDECIKQLDKKSKRLR